MRTSGGAGEGVAASLLLRTGASATSAARVEARSGGLRPRPSLDRPVFALCSPRRGMDFARGGPPQPGIRHAILTHLEHSLPELKVGNGVDARRSEKSR